VIDLKLDQLPANAADDFENIPDDELTAEQRTIRARRRGLSINDTVAATANMSVGARGFDTSGVEGGAGAGAGISNLTPGARGENPAPHIVPGARGTGNAPRMEGNSQEQPTIELDADDLGPSDAEISARAYQRWHERGCPHGTPEEDWRRAEEELRLERVRVRTTQTARAANA
jgi:hypothetical protein